MTDTFLDTNIIARLLLGDNVEQGEEVLRLFRSAKKGEQKLHINPEVLIELHYVLAKIYKIDKEQIIKQFTKLLGYSFVKCENHSIFEDALDTFLTDNNISLEDAYFINYCLTKNLQFYSFDEKALKIYKTLKN